MKIRTVMLLGVGLLMGGTAFAQEYPKWEIPVDLYVCSRESRECGETFLVERRRGRYRLQLQSILGIKGDLQGYGALQVCSTT